MSSLEAQILKLNQKYIQMFITHIIENKTNINEEELTLAWKTVSGANSKSKKNTKKRRTGYTTYLIENRPIIAEKFPNLKSTEIVSKIASDWKTLENSVKEEYNKKAKEFMNSQEQETQGEQGEHTQGQETRGETRGETQGETQTHSILKEEPFEKLNIKQLRSLCEKYELFTYGKKNELIDRLNKFKDDISKEN